MLSCLEGPGFEPGTIPSNGGSHKGNLCITVQPHPSQVMLLTSMTRHCDPSSSKVPIVLAAVGLSVTSGGGSEDAHDNRDRATTKLGFMLDPLHQGSPHTNLVGVV